MSRGRSRHAEILKSIKDFELYNMRMPTRKELMFQCKIGRGSLQRIIRTLEEKKKLKRLPRGILEFKIVV